MANIIPHPAQTKEFDERICFSKKTVILGEFSNVTCLFKLCTIISVFYSSFAHKNMHHQKCLTFGVHIKNGNSIFYYIFFILSSVFVLKSKTAPIMVSIISGNI